MTFDQVLSLITESEESTRAEPGDVVQYYRKGELLTYGVGRIGDVYTDSNRLLHRVGGPAIEKCKDFMSARLMDIYFIHGNMHRSNGPARVEYDPKGEEVLEESYYINNKRYTKAAYERYYGGVSSDQKDNFDNMMKGFE